MGWGHIECEETIYAALVHIIRIEVACTLTCTATRG